jgi:hypothetical protein
MTLRVGNVSRKGSRWAMRMLYYEHDSLHLYYSRSTMHGSSKRVQILGSGGFFLHFCIFAFFLFLFCFWLWCFLTTDNLKGILLKQRACHLNDKRKKM